MDNQGIKSSVADFSHAVCRSVLMVGPDIYGKGGIASVVRSYQTSNIFATFRIKYVPTHRDGRFAIKAATALRGWWLVLLCLVRLDKPLVHIHTASRASFWRKCVVCLIVRMFRRPYIMHLHGGGFSEFFRDDCGPVTQRLVRAVFRHAIFVIALSKEWQDQILQMCPQANTVVIANAVPLPSIEREVHPSSKGESSTILFMGRLGKSKGVDDLIHAFARIASRYPRVQILCVGDGDASAYRRVASGLGVGDSVKFPGWLDSNGCQSHFIQASVFVLPSYAEGLPISLLEAMSWQLPVVSCPVGGIPELIQNGQNGLLVDPGDIEALSSALDQLLADPDLRWRLACAARATIENGYSLEANQDRLGQLYAACGLKVLPTASN